MIQLSRKAIAWNLAALAILALILLWFWPELLHKGVYEYGILHWPFILLGLFLGHQFFKRLPAHEKLTSRLISTLTTVSFFTGIIGGIVYSLVGYGTYSWFTNPTQMKTHVISDPQKFRFTPRRVAYRNMNDSINDAAENIEADGTLPIILKNGYGYAAPVTPQGIEPTFRNIIDGVLMYEDRPGIVDDEKRRHRIGQTFMVGPEMQWFDSLERKLVLNDFFTVYDNPHLLAWNPEKPDELVMAVPKTKYFLFLFPYWAGVTIVNSDGSLEDFTPEEIAVHPLLKNQWVYPEGMALHYTKLQNFGTKMGILSTYFQVSGKLEVHEMPEIEPDKDSSASDMVTNQQPFLMAGADGYPYLVVMTKAEGGGSGIFRAYYVNASTGVSQYVEYEKGTVQYGPVASLTRVKKVPGYNWRREAGKSVSGNIIVVEPVQVVRAKDPEVLYWKGSIVATNFAAISATVVAPASDPENFMLFRTREAFEAWLSGDDSVTTPGAEASIKMQELLTLLGDASASAKEIGTMIEQLQSIQK